MTKTKPLLQVEDRYGTVYSMPGDDYRAIIEVHYCTAYYQFVIQDVVIDRKGFKQYFQKDIYVILDGSNWVDLIAVDPERIGTLVTEGEYEN